MSLQDILTTQNDPLMYWLIAMLVIPMLSFLFGGFLKKTAPKATTGLILVNLLIAVYLLVTQINKSIHVIRGNWFQIGDLQLTYSFMIDELMLIMSVIVNLISFLVHFFSLEYMRKDERRVTYFRYLGLFTFSMMGIVVFYDLLLIFIFWELVGLSSYLLIGFWF